MTMKKILKEWKEFQQLNEASYGELDKLGINIFLRNFADSHNVDKQRAMSDWSVANMPSDIEEGSLEWSKLKNGYAHTWAEIVGRREAVRNIQKQVDLWEEDLKNALEAKDEKAERELAFFNSNAEEFLEKKVKNVESRKDVSYKGQGAGLGGLMDDWFLGRNAFTVFKAKMLRAVDRLAKNHPEAIEKHGKIEFSPQDQAPLPDLPTEPVSQRAKDLEAFFAKYGGK